MVHDFLHLPNAEEGVERWEKQQADAAVREKRRAEIADAITKMAEMPGWKMLEEEIERLRQTFNCGPEVYTDEPNKAPIHTGIRYGLQLITDIVRESIKYINDPLYAKETKE